ncbi:MAG: hypothetical protein WKF87_08265 [Chryseolinea sp.]
MAKKIFGNEEPLGQHVQMPNDADRETDCVITDIMKDLPPNSHFHANFVVPLIYEWSQHTEWSQDFLDTFITLENGTEHKLSSNRLNEVYRKMAQAHTQVIGGKNFSQVPSKQSKPHRLSCLTSIWRPHPPFSRTVSLYGSPLSL